MGGYKSWLLTVSLCTPLAVQATEPESCASMRFVDVGWTDIAVTTAVTRQVPESLGYKTKINLLLVPVTHHSLANSDPDVSLGNWVPIMTNDIKQYAEKGTVETLRVNPEGTKCTLVVPQYAYDGGLRSFASIAKFSDKLGNEIYDIGPGNDSNHATQSMIDKNTSELGKFKLVESNEAGILSQVQRTIRHNQWMMFLGWEPYPMNVRFQMKYLGGGDDFSGPNYGGTTIYTNVCEGYVQECANIGQLLKNLSFTPEMKNRLADVVFNENKKPEGAVKAWLRDHSEQLDAWLAGAITRDGQLAAAAAKLAFTRQAVGRSPPAFSGP